MSQITIRRMTTSDAAAVRTVEMEAFGQAAEADIVEALHRDGDTLVSLVAEFDEEIVGHIELFRMLLNGEPTICGLGPVAVSPSRQRIGIGVALVQAGIDALKQDGETLCILLGHPDYYPRFGFSAQAARPFTSQYSGNPAYMALALGEPAPTGGTVAWPAAFGIT